MKWRDHLRGSFRREFCCWLYWVKCYLKYPFTRYNPRPDFRWPRHW